MIEKKEWQRAIVCTLPFELSQGQGNYFVTISVCVWGAPRVAISALYLRDNLKSNRIKSVQISCHF